MQLTLAQAAKMAGITKQGVCRGTDAGTLACIKDEHGRLLVQAADVQRVWPIRPELEQEAQPEAIATPCPGGRRGRSREPAATGVAGRTRRGSRPLAATSRVGVAALDGSTPVVVVPPDRGRQGQSRITFIMTNSGLAGG
jgi:hypothetical protein